jgi:SAM-dependent methyltransferase
VRRVSAPSDSLVLIGAGTTTLVAELIEADYAAIRAVDISQVALDRLRVKLGERGQHIEFLRADVRTVRFPAAVDLWHDRATFHFLTDPRDQAEYVRSVSAAVRPGGHVVMATFAQGGPTQCSGLAVERHSTESLKRLFGERYELIESFERDHVTPGGAPQRFLHAVLRSLVG